MERDELNAATDALLKKIAAIRCDDYYACIAALREFESLAHQASHLLPPSTTMHIEDIEGDFEAMRKHKSSSQKSQHFNSGISGLRADVASMKRGR